MSNNLYNILNNFAKLTPKEEPKQEAQPVYESVDPRGSVLAGVAKVESTLNEKYMGFKKTVAAIKKGGSAENPEAVAAAIGRKKYGKEAFQKAAAKGQKMGEAVAGQNYGFGQQSDGKFVQPGQKFDTATGQPLNRPTAATTQVGGTSQQDVMGDQVATMVQYRDAYAKRGDTQRAQYVQDQIRLMRAGQPYDKAFFGFAESVEESEVMEKAPPGMEDMVLRLKKQYPGEPAKAYATAWSIYNKKHGKKTEGCECDEELDEDYKHKGTAYGGQAQKDEPEDDDDDAPKVKKTKGRPKKDDSEKASAKLPKFGKGEYKLPAHKGEVKKVTGKAMSDEPPKGSPERAEWEAKQARKDKRKVKESTTMTLKALTESVNFKRMMEEQHMTMDEMLECLMADIKSAKDTGELSDLLKDCLMIHGAGKKQLSDAAQQPTFGQSLPPGEIPGKADLLKTPVTPWEKAKAVAKDTAKGMLGHKDVEHFGTGKPGLEEELNELAKLAGITDEGNAFTGKLASTPKGGKFDLDGKTFTDTSDLDEADMEEGNAFTGKLASTPKGGEFELDGKKYKDTSTTLEDIAKLSGIAIEGKDYGDTDVEEAPEYDNTPEPEVEGEDVLTKGGDGEVAGKEKAMSKDGAARFSDNPLAVKEEAFDPLSALSDKLKSAYESIKIQK